MSENIPAPAEQEVPQQTTTPPTDDAPQGEPPPEKEPLSPEAEAAKAEQKRKFYALRQLAKAAKDQRDNSTQAQQTARELEAERRTRADLEARLAKLEGPKPPNANDFPVYEDYIVARAKYELQQEAKPQNQQKEPPKQPPPDVRAHIEQREKQYGAAVESLLSETYTKYPELATFQPEEEMPNFRELNPAVLQGVFQSDSKHEVLNHLMRNPEVAWKLASLNPQQTFKELGRIEALISAGRVTNAPAPPTTVGGNASPKAGLRDDLPIEEWTRRRNAEVAARRRR
jgi:hypothetical protein